MRALCDARSAGVGDEDVVAGLGSGFRRGCRRCCCAAERWECSGPLLITELPVSEAKERGDAALPGLRLRTGDMGGSFLPCPSRRSLPRRRCDTGIRLAMVVFVPPLGVRVAVVALLVRGLHGGSVC